MAKTGAPKIAAGLPDVETERLILRRFQTSDVDALAPVFAKAEVWMFPYGRGFSREETTGFVENQVSEWGKNGFGCWLATDKATDRVIGYVGISVPYFLPEILPAAEVGWRFDPDVWGKGFATEGASAALDQAFATLGLPRVCSAPQSGNPASSRVCDRLGMQFQRSAIAQATEKRGPVEVQLYWIEKECWLRRNKPRSGS